MLRKQAKREKLERQQQEVARVQSMLKLKTVLSGLLKSRVKSDFLDGSNGAVVG
jgi:Caprin-1 dimerization domain